MKKEQSEREMHQIKSKLRQAVDGTNPRVKKMIEGTAHADSEVILYTHEL